MKVVKQEHIKHPWKVHNLLKDFRVEDIWLLPIDLDKEHNLNDVLEQLVETKNKISETGLVGKLFNLRQYLGNIFHWDNKNVLKLYLKVG